MQATRWQHAVLAPRLLPGVVPLRCVLASGMPRKPPDIDIGALISALPEPQADLAHLARLGQPRSYRKGAIVIEEGDPGDSIYIILSGRLRAFSTNLAQDREITYGSYGPGEYVGELGLDGGPRSASVMAMDASTCVRVTRDTLQAHFIERPAFAFELLAKVISLARSATLSARQMALNDVYGRIKLLLERLAVPDADGHRVMAERLTHKDIASHVGCSREMVSRVMKDLERGGYVRTDGASLCLLKALPARW